MPALHAVRVLSCAGLISVWGSLCVKCTRGLLQTPLQLLLRMQVGLGHCLFEALYLIHGVTPVDLHLTYGLPSLHTVCSILGVAGDVSGLTG